MSIVKFKRLYDHAIIPSRSTDGSAGFDLHNMCIDFVKLYPGQRATIETGIAVQIPRGYVGLIRGRSGLGTKHGIDVLAGVIDSDYRGEIKVCVVNHDASLLGSYVVEFAQRIAQLLVVPCLLDSEVVEALDDTGRGENGFGSTGS